MKKNPEVRFLKVCQLSTLDPFKVERLLNILISFFFQLTTGIDFKAHIFISLDPTLLSVGNHILISTSFQFFCSLFCLPFFISLSGCFGVKTIDEVAFQIAHEMSHTICRHSWVFPLFFFFFLFFSFFSHSG